MKVNGSCHCGQITFEADIDPNGVRICHCTDCQNLSGSAYRLNVQTPAESFVPLTGTPKIYIKTAESGNKRAHAYGPNCGTPIYAAAPHDTESYGLRVGTLNQRAQLRPSTQIWFRSAHSWATDIRDVEHIERQ